MKKFIPYIVALVLGVILGVWLFPRHKYPKETLVQKDTIIVRDTITYTKEVLKEVTKEVEGKVEYIYVPTKETDTVYVEKETFLRLPKKYYHTQIDNVEIWHSGIQSTIDGIRYINTTEQITETIRVEKPQNWHYSFDLGLSVGSCSGVYIKPNLGAEIGYKKLALRGEVGCGLLPQEGLLKPLPYYELGIKYSFVRK